MVFETAVFIMEDIPLIPGKFLLFLSKLLLKQLNIPFSHVLQFVQTILWVHSSDVSSQGDTCALCCQSCCSEGLNPGFPNLRLEIGVLSGLRNTVCRKLTPGPRTCWKKRPIGRARGSGEASPQQVPPGEHLIL